MDSSASAFGALEPNAGRLDSDAARCVGVSFTTGPAAGRRGGAGTAAVVIRRRRGCGTGAATPNDAFRPNDEDLPTTIDVGRLGFWGFTVAALSKAPLALGSGARLNPGEEPLRGTAFGERLLSTEGVRCGRVPSVELVDVLL